MVHLAVAHKAIVAAEYPCDIIGPLYYEDDILTKPLSLRGGRALPPERPGLGVELDEAKVEKYRVR
jgi:muconate cycloisomerase